MKVTPLSTSRRSSPIASRLSRGGPKTPGPVMRMMIINKVDLAGPEQVKKVRAWIDGHF